MEKSKKFILKDLEQAVFKNPSTGIDGNAEGEGAGLKKPAERQKAGKAKSKDSFSKQQDFIVNYTPSTGGVKPVSYSESRINGPTRVLGKPIHGSDDPERAIVAIGMGQMAAAVGIKMTLVVENVDGTLQDKMVISTLAKNYDVVRKDLVELGFVIVAEVTGVYFMVKTMEGTFETFQNINQPEEVVQIVCGNSNSFNEFQLSILAQSTR